MVKKSDIGGKRLIGLSPQAWGRWVTGDKTIKVQEIINSELQWIERESDVLLKAHSPECGDFILLNELQLRHDAKMPRRMRAYAALVEEKYGLLVYPVVVNILQPGPTEIIRSRYESEIMGCRAYQDYRVINLWEIEAETVFEQNLSSLLPFVPILKGGNSEVNLRQALLNLRKNQVLGDLEPLLSFFASFVFDIPLVQQMMRWDMTVLRESPWYNEILKEGLQEGLQKGRQEGLQEGELRGEQRGRQEGLQEGRQEGRQEGQRKIILLLLNHKFDGIESPVVERINRLSLEQLEAMGESLLDFRQISDLEAWLKDAEKSNDLKPQVDIQNGNQLDV
ncbi:Rpn family recombination-promoting nuclease/putative transposase [Cylindrospermopsis raciborskii G7]|uniref:Rpn family recombination-promoting nuclease/putative transposase n=1 Tax=Cylindrospermopsis raciborskii TaxID=77022 RepID=UPI001FCFB037|nr:Rpn family recombination-promoting nuclease/putative transposase [Cylindrospermopsis raciborskii]